MPSHSPSLPIALLIAGGSLAAATALSAGEPSSRSRAEANRQLIQASFDRWKAGTGGPFELLAPDATWTITGNSVVAKKYTTRAEFIDTVITPFNARLSKPLIPTIRSLHADGDTVIVLFDGEALARDGKPYRNTYAWFMGFKQDQQIVGKVTAFFDAHAFDDFWKRVPAH